MSDSMRLSDGAQVVITNREGVAIVGCIRPHPPVADPWLTRHADGTITINWPDEAFDRPRDYVMVSAEILQQMVDTHNELVTKIGRLVPPSFVVTTTGIVPVLSEREQ